MEGKVYQMKNSIVPWNRHTINSERKVKIRKSRDNKDHTRNPAFRFERTVEMSL